MSYFLKSRHKRIVLLFIALFFIIYSLQSIISKNLKVHKATIADYLSNLFGYRLSLDNISFNLIKGIRLEGLSLFYSPQEKAPIYIKDAFVSFRIFPLLFKKISIAKISISESLFLVKNSKEGVNLQVIYSDIYKKISQNKSLSLDIVINRLNIYVGLARILYVDDPYLEKNMQILLNNVRITQRENKFNFQSDAQFKYRLPEDLYLRRFFKNNFFRQDLKLSIQGNIQGPNLIMNMIILTLNQEQVIGMGITKNFAERIPHLDIILIPSTISLHNVPFLRDNFNSRGSLFVATKLIGPMDNVKIFINGLMDDCGFTYHISSGEIFDIRKLEGGFEYRDGMVNIDNAYFELNDLPLNFNLRTYTGLDSDIFLKISFPQKFLTAQNQFLNHLEAVFKGKIKKTLRGDLELKASFARKGRNADISANFINADFDYYNPKVKYFRSESVEFSYKNLERVQKLYFLNLKSNIYTARNRFEIRGINFSGYNSQCLGKIDIEIKDKAIFSGAVIAHKLDVKKLMRDLNAKGKLLSGSLEAKISLNNSLKEFIEGNFYVKDGVVDLDVLASAVKLPSLKDRHFKMAYAAFAVSEELIRIKKMVLLSPDIMLNARWDTNGKIEGALNIKMSAKFLRQSEQFRKLLNLTKLKSPDIDFKFVLGGLTKAIRIMWQKGEFKEKIMQKLPSWTKRSIESNLDKAIEDLTNQ